jgi:hypothetical protein
MAGRKNSKSTVPFIYKDPMAHVNSQLRFDADFIDLALQIQCHFLIEEMANL